MLVAVVVVLASLSGARALTAPSRAELVAAVTQWFAATGGRHEAVAAQETEGAGWGLVAVRDVRAGESLVVTPRHACLAAADGPEWLQRTAGEELGGLTAAGAIACKVADERGLGAESKWAPFLASLPTREDLADVPALWPDGDELLAGTQSGRSRSEIVDRWRDELAVANRRRAKCALAPYDWDAWALAQTLVMSRGYNVPRLEYAIIPFVDFVNHDDSPSATVTVDSGGNVHLVAVKDIPAHAQVYSSYSAGLKIDAIKMLQAFGWLPLDQIVASCAFDCVSLFVRRKRGSLAVQVEAIRKNDDLADAKIALMDAGAPNAGRIVLATDEPDCVADAAADALVSIRLAVRLSTYSLDLCLGHVRGRPLRDRRHRRRVSLVPGATRERRQRRCGQERCHSPRRAPTRRPRLHPRHPPSRRRRHARQKTSVVILLCRAFHCALQAPISPPRPHSASDGGSKRCSPGSSPMTRVCPMRRSPLSCLLANSSLVQLHVVRLLRLYHSREVSTWMMP